MLASILIVILLILGVSGIYSFPVRKLPFNQLYAAVPEEIRRSLQRFRRKYALRQVRVDGLDWHYLSVGDGEATILLLHGMMRKAQFVARFHCVLDYFQPVVSETSGVEMLIVETDNDPLVEKTLRDMLKTTYPSARIITLQGAGHFPYLNRTAEYTKMLGEFFDGN